MKRKLPASVVGVAAPVPVLGVGPEDAVALVAIAVAKEDEAGAVVEDVARARIHPVWAEGATSSG